MDNLDIKQLQIQTLKTTFENLRKQKEESAGWISIITIENIETIISRYIVEIIDESDIECKEAYKTEIFREIYK